MGVKREKLESYLNKKVTVTLFDNTEYSGTLKKGNGYFETPKEYNIPEERITFKLSHVKKIKEL